MAFAAPQSVGCVRRAPPNAPVCRRQRVAPPGHVLSVRARMGMTPGGVDNGEPEAGAGDAEDDVAVYRKGTGKKYSGDELPFEVKVISPPPHVLGQFKLHPRTGCGDIIQMKEQSYVVKRVRSRFVWSSAGGSPGPRLARKTIEIKSLARKSIENYLERVLRDS